jgi:hypothetical protein
MVNKPGLIVNTSVDCYLFLDVLATTCIAILGQAATTSAAKNRNFPGYLEFPTMDKTFKSNDSEVLY